MFLSLLSQYYAIFIHHWHFNSFHSHLDLMVASYLLSYHLHSCFACFFLAFHIHIKLLSIYNSLIYLIQFVVNFNWSSFTILASIYHIKFILLLIKSINMSLHLGVSFVITTLVGNNGTWEKCVNIFVKLSICFLNLVFESHEFFSNAILERGDKIKLFVGMPLDIIEPFTFLLAHQFLDHPIQPFQLIVISYKYKHVYFNFTHYYRIMSFHYVITCNYDWHNVIL